MVRREGESRAGVHPQRPRLGGTLPGIGAAAAAVKARSFLIDGEVVVVDLQGLASSSCCEVARVRRRPSSGPSTSSSWTGRISALSRSSGARMHWRGSR